MRNEAVAKQKQARKLIRDASATVLQNCQVYDYCSPNLTQNATLLHTCQGHLSCCTRLSLLCSNAFTWPDEHGAQCRLLLPCSHTTMQPFSMWLVLLCHCRMLLLLTLKPFADAAVDAATIVCLLPMICHLCLFVTCAPLINRVDDVSLQMHLESSFTYR